MTSRGGTGGAIIDRRKRGKFAAAGLVGLIGAAAAAVGLNGVDRTLCYFGLGECVRVVDEDREIELLRILVDISRRSEAIWASIFAQRGAAYIPASIVLYDEPIETECGELPAGASPTYCKLDRRIYIDLAFFDLIVERYGAAGDTIPAFVVAHEVSHHVQNQTGDFDRYLALLQAYEAMSEEERENVETPNQLLVRFELQADCLTGVAAAKAQERYQLLDDEDIAEAVEGATKLGDDNVQRVESGFINEESFTHGSGEQRLKWLDIGYSTGDVDACDTWTPAYEDL